MQVNIVSENQTTNKHIYFQFPHNEIHFAQTTKIISKKEGYKTMVLNHFITEQFIPMNFDLEQNYPNPFNGKTFIKYHVPHKSKVTIMVFNCDGFILEKVIKKEHNPGVYEVEIFLDGLPEGTYFYQMITDKYTETRSMELIKMN